MKNRTIIGIICIVLALAVTFGVAPLVNKLADSKTEIVRMKNDVVQGHQIKEDDIEVISVGGYNLPEKVIKSKDSVVGKYAAIDLKAQDYLFPTKITDTADAADDVFKTLDGNKQAISITIQTFAGGLSGKLKNGDIVSLLVYDENKTFQPAALTYVKVITTTTAGGTDKDNLKQNEDGTYEMPTTLTVMVNPLQAKLLVEYENSGKIHADLVYRGDEKTAEKFLKAQDEFLAKIEKETEKENTGDHTSNGNDPVHHANDIINGKVDYYKPGGDDKHE